jgi:assimilatory nitrate reductase catalytic subunit
VINSVKRSCPVKTTCPYCGVGCGVLATVTDNGSVDIKGDPDHPSNYGRLCSKGSALGETIDLTGRMLEPHIHGRPATWDSALDLVAEKFKDTIAKHGPDSVAFYISGQLLTEDYYVANKLMKGYIGSGNIDTNSRLCMASSVAGQRRAFGSDTVPGTYEDLELADLIVLVGSNLAWCHPVLYQRIEAAKAKRPEMKVVLIDPRRTMTSDIADLHLPLKADGDVALFQGLLSYLAENNALNNQYINSHTNGFKEALGAAGKLTAVDISSITGLSSRELRDFYDLVAKTEKTVTVYSQGVNQSSIGTDKVGAIINCHLATGRIGRPGMGPFSVTGQPNAMGGREVGGLANMLACHMDIENANHRNLVQTFWQSPTMADKPGLKAVEMFNAVAKGDIKAIWIMGTNPVDSLPHADHVKSAIVKCPFVVVSDIMETTDTTELAQVKLPSLGWGEKDGMVTNSERRISRQRAFLPAPGAARADWWQLAEVGRRMGYEQGMTYEDNSTIIREYAELSAFENSGSRDFDIGALAAISAENYAQLAPIQWPCKNGEASAETRFFSQGNFYTPDKKAVFQAQSERPKDSRSFDLPFTLNTGRIRDQWHTMTRTGKSPRLGQHLAEPFVEIHLQDAKDLGIESATLVEVHNTLGSIIVRALITDRIQQKSVFVPMHWTDQFASSARVDTLVEANTDPYSGQPASKASACSLRPFKANLFGFLVSQKKPKNLESEYWALARCEAGWRVELGLKETPPNLSEFAAELLGTNQFIDYLDAGTGERRFATFDNGALSAVLHLSPTPVLLSRNWIVSELGRPVANKMQRYRLIAGRPAKDVPDIGVIICSCHSIGQNQIVSAMVEKGCNTVKDIGNCTKAGTNCGSCKSEINQILSSRLMEAAE